MGVEVTGRSASSETILEPVGIRGWLILPTIGLVINLLGDGVHWISIIVNFPLLIGLGFDPPVYIKLIAEFAYDIFMIYVAIRFFGMKRNAPSMYIYLLGASVLVIGISLALWLAAGPGKTDFEPIAIGKAQILALTLINAVVWIIYFKTSNRVKNTFVK